VSASTRAESRAAPTGQRLRGPRFQRCSRAVRVAASALGTSFYSTAQGAWIGHASRINRNFPFRSAATAVAASEKAPVASVGKTVQRRDPLTPGDGRRVFFVFLRDLGAACVGRRLVVRRDLSSTGLPDRVPRPLPASLDPP
jgi:hypothetical protein